MMWITKILPLTATWIVLCQGQNLPVYPSCQQSTTVILGLKNSGEIFKFKHKLPGNLKILNGLEIDGFWIAEDGTVTYDSAVSNRNHHTSNDSCTSADPASSGSFTIEPSNSITFTGISATDGEIEFLGL